MNVIDKFLVMLVLLPEGFFRQMGVDTKQLKAILTTKIMMGNRMPSSFRGFKAAKPGKTSQMQGIRNMIISVFLGLMFLFSFFIGADYITKLSFFFSFYIFFLASVLIADFTTVLIDVRDNAIILPKPVNDSTFVVSRLLYIIVFVTKIVIPLTLVSFAFIAYTEGFWAFLVLFLLVILATLLTIFLINAVYILVLKITTPQRFKNIISYFQIVFAVTVYASYQVVPRLISKSSINSFSLKDSTWAMLTPPYWFAGAWQYLHSFSGELKLLACLLLAFVVPFLSIYVVVKYFAPSFNQKLAMVGSTGDEPTATSTLKQPQTKIKSDSYAKFFGKLITKAGPERMGFLHAWKMTARSRDFKMKVYPSLGYLLVYAALIFLKNPGEGSKVSLPEPNSFIYIFVIYLCNFILITALMQLSFSDKYKAAWIYYITPVEKPGALILGAVKSIIVKFYFPVAALIIALAYWFVGVSALPNFILGVCNQMLIVFAIAFLTFNNLPFSVLANQKVKGSGFIRSLMSMLIPFTVGVVHYAISDYWPVVFLLIILSCIAIWMAMDSIKNKDWSRIRISEENQ